MTSLERFIEEQRTTYAVSLAEIRRGMKESHWMWFIFPQIAGLGRNDQTRYYAIADADEAARYLAHPILGPRLIECTDAVLSLGRVSMTDVFGDTDAMKLRSCATLFAQVSAPGSPFHRLLDTFYEGKPDDKTLTLLAG